MAVTERELRDRRANGELYEHLKAVMDPDALIGVIE